MPTPRPSVPVAKKDPAAAAPAPAAASTAAATTDTPAAKAAVRTSKKARARVPHGQAHIQATYNNTIVTLTDLQGNALAWSSSGSMGFKGAKKATPYAAGKVVEDVLAKVSDIGLTEVDVFVKGIGSGREAAARAFQANGISVVRLKDVTPVPHNGVRRPRPRRV